ncbi:MAG: hypothetical protein K6C97_02230, partial [Treponema sp.]|nr:hypothetical protein [Treponema sp.]
SKTINTNDVYVDITKPGVSVTASSILSYMGDGGFTVTGSVSDAGSSSSPVTGSGIASLIVKEEHRTSSSASWTPTDASGTDGASVTVSNGGWSQHLPLGENTSPSEGTYRYTFTVKDNSGNTDSYQFETTVDKTAPTLTIENPGSGANAKTGTKSIDSSTYRFSGSVEEANIISAIYYKLLPVTDAAPATPSSWTGWTPVTAEENWSFYRDIGSASGAIAEGKHKIYMYALDGAGNLSAQVSREFHVDLDAPVVTASAPQYVNASTNENGARTVTISGTVTESHGLASFYIKRNDEEGNGSSVTPNNSGNWTYTDTPTSDGTYTYTIKATDLVGKTNTSLTKTVIVDTALPTVSNEAAKFKVPTSTETEGSLFKFEGQAGSVADTGSGLDKVDIIFTSTSTEPAVNANAQASITPATNGSWSSTVEFANVFNNQGTKYLWVKAYDKAGNTSAWTNVKSFVYDTAAPTISFTATAENKNPAANSYRKAGFTLEVNATDSYGIGSVKVARAVSFASQPAGWPTGYYTDSACTAAASTFTASTTYYRDLGDAALSDGKYSKAFRVGAETGTNTLLADGAYNFTITAIDSSGKTKSVSRTITVDTTAPSIGTKSISSSVACTIGDVEWYKTNPISLSINSTDATSGITSVQVSTDGTNFTNPSSLMLSGSSWQGSIACPNQGLNTIYIKATDAAGNSNEINETNSIEANIDTEAPDTPVFLGVDTTPASDITTVLVNKQNPITVYAALKDKGDSSTGIAATNAFERAGKSGTSAAASFAAVSAFTPAWAASTPYTEGIVVKNGTALYQCNTAHTSGASFDETKWTSLADYSLWSYTIPTADMTSGGINFTVKDKAGNSQDYTLFQMVVDNTPPEVVLKTPNDAGSAAGTQINGTISLSGTASDSNGLSTTESLKLYYTTMDSPSVESFTSGNDASTGWKEISTTAHGNSWTFTNIDTSSLEKENQDTTTVYFTVAATDKAGNT